MRSRKCRTNSLPGAIAALTGIVGVISAGCGVSSGDQVPEAKAGPRATPIQYAQSLVVSDSKPDESAHLPFTGTQTFTLANGTSGTLTIAENGTAIVKLHSDQNLAIAYQGNFSQAQADPLPEDDPTYQHAAEGLVANGCIDDQACEARLREVTHQVAESVPAEDSIYQDDRFIYQDFNSEFFRQILDLDRSCEVITVAATCTTRIYNFKDGKLKTQRHETASHDTASHDTASMEYVLTFHQPQTTETAFTYLTALNEGKTLDSAASSMSQACPHDMSHATCQAELIFMPDGAVSGVKLTHWSFD